jgi:uncharacterized membrane protein YeaQ/YmgE (transglycosylase-associated protein family)
MNITQWIIFGIIAGIFIHQSDRTNLRGGLLGALLLGVLGAIEGGYLIKFLLDSANEASLQGVAAILPTVAAIIGAMFLVSLRKTFSRIS